MKTIVMLFGLSGSGKSGIAAALAQGSRSLIDLPLRDELFSCRVRNSVGLESGPIVNAWQHPARIRTIIDALLNDYDCIIVEPWQASTAITEIYAATYRIVPMHVIVPHWLLEHRLKLRLVRQNRMGKYAKLREAIYKKQDLVAYANTATPGIEPLFVDASDWPVRAMTDDEAREMLTPRPAAEPQLKQLSKHYQKALHINGKWYGNTSGDRFIWEKQRLDAILPARLDGEVVLDIGASEGGFCFEALNRGALYCQALELRQEHVAWLREWRTAAQMPIGAACTDIVTEPIPPSQIADTPTRYDLALLLNVLHHVRPRELVEATLEKVLAACNSIVIEGPWCEGDEPRQMLETQHPNATGLPDAWIEKVAGRHGFMLDSVADSMMAPPERRVWKFHREG